MLKVTMFSSATKIKGQGVGSAYSELIKLIKKYDSTRIELKINNLEKTDISHYHTIDFKFYLSTFFNGRGSKIGYVHFLPETLEGSIELWLPIKLIFYRYVVAFYQRMDYLVVVNPSFITKLEKYGIKKDKITYIPNFVSKDEFYRKDSIKFEVRKNLNISQDKFVVIGVGQVQERKGVFDFVELAIRNPKIQFIWVGGFSFGRITDGYVELKKIVDNPPKNLFFTGIIERTEMNNYYNMADLFVLPSYNELFPMSVLEAFNCGVPVMLRDLGLYRSIIDGYYEPAKNLASMDEKIKNFSNNKQKLQKLEELSKKAAQFYSEKRLAKVWLNFYEKHGKSDE